MSNTDGRLRCAVVGLGKIGVAHALVLSSSACSDLVVCVDRDGARAESCPAGVAFRDDLRRVLAEFELDAVVVATPEDSHREICEQALAAGLAVLCEKPIAGTLADADALVAAANRARSLFAVAHTSRFDPRYIELNAAATDGRLGEPVHLSARRLCEQGERAYYGERTTLAVELGVHDLDLFRWLGGEVVDVYAAVCERGGIADSMVGVVRFRSGAVGALEWSWALRAGAGVDWEHGFSFIGRNGFAHVDGRSRGLSIHVEGGARYPDVLTLVQMDGRAYGILAAQDEHFLACVRDGGEWPLTPTDARSSLALALALDRSVGSGQAVGVAG